MHNLEVRIPGIAVAETTYVLEILLNNILGIPYKISYHPLLSVCFVVDNKSVSFDYHFFYDDHVLNAYSSSKIPRIVKESIFKVGGIDYPVSNIYGSTIMRSEKQDKIFDFDLIGSTFFMLSRWEEYAVKSTDKHGRFEAAKALAVKSNFIHKPVVNQYANFLYGHLKVLGLIQNRKINKYKIEISHDIDYITKWKNFRSLIGGIKAQFNNKVYPSIYTIVKAYRQSRRNKRNDPYYTFKFLSEEAAKRNLSCCFYFKANKVNQPEDKTDYKLEDPEIREAIELIEGFGHDIGLHSSYNSYLNIEEIEKEKKSLESILKRKVTRIRQDYLRIKVPDSLIIFNRLSFTKDSSISYTNYPGFRNGICCPFPIFDFLNRVKLDLIQLPLVCMMSIGRQKTLEQIEEEFLYFAELVQKHNGHVSMLWHNSDLETANHKNTYKRILNKL